MDDHHDEEENQTNALGIEEEISDSDDDMDVDCVDDSRGTEKLDSELVDSDVNVEATELTSSDVDLSDESDLKGELSSDEEGSVGHHEIDESVIDSDEDTFPLEVKDTKEDWSDEKDENDELDELDESTPLTKSTSEVDDEEEEQLEEEEYEHEEEGDDDGAEMDAKSAEDAASDYITEPSDEVHESNSINEDEEEISSSIAAEENEEAEPESTDRKQSANGDSPKSTENEELDEGTRNADNSPLRSKIQSDLEEGNDEVDDRSPEHEDNVLDCTPNFKGFDPEITNKTMQIFYILQQNYQDLVSQLQMVQNREENESVMEVDPEHPSQLYSTFSEGTSLIENDTVGEEIAYEKLTDEQAAANKRVKKKRKFFDEFDEDKTDPPKRPKEQRDDDSVVDTNTSENKENFMNCEKIPIKEEPIVAVPATSSTIAVSTPNPPIRPEIKSKFDISNPDFKEPFKYGWRREVVYRFISLDGQKKSADISYFTPQGKKLRSSKQIIENLPKDGSLSIKNFTFSKELIFRNRESELEVRRFTKKMEKELLIKESPDVSSDNIIDRRLGIEPITTPTSVLTAAASQSSFDSSIKKPTTGQAMASSTPLSSLKRKEPQKSKTNAKTTSSSHNSETASKSKLSSKKTTKNPTEMDGEEITNATPKLAMPKIMFRGPNMANSNAAVSKVTSGKPSGMKIKIVPPSMKQSCQKTVKKASSSSKSSKNAKSQKRIDKSGATDAEIGLLPVADRSSHVKSIRGTQTCSISCPLALGTIPTLQCSICLCSYHFECCGMDADRAVYGYVCKTCRMCETKKENVHPMYRTTARGSSHSARGIYSTETDDYDSLMLSSYVAGGAPFKGAITGPGATSTKIVDGVTTWLPSSSNIHLKTTSGGVLSMTNATSDDTSSTTSTISELRTPLVQGVLELGGRRFVVVPKQSVLSVSQNASTVIENHTTLCERTTNMLARPVSSVDQTTAANTLLVNPSDVNNAGVVLVPVVPSKNTFVAAYSPQHMPNSSSSSSAQYASYVNYDHHSRLKFPIESTCLSTYGINCNSINGRSPNELCTYESVANRTPAPAEYHSSFTLSNISRIYDPLLMSLKYLTVRDLLRISMTCKFLNRIASESCLWRTVRLKNSQVHDWKGFAKALQKYGTKRLDMRKMLCSTVPEELNKMWEEFLQVVPTITSLEHIDFSRTPMNVVDTVAATCPNLAVFNAVYLKNGSLTLDNFTCLKNLVELRLKGVGGIELKRNEPLLHFINKDNLKEISLTCVKNIDMELLKTISGASNLITLELGDCAKLPSEFVYEIGKLKKLQKLRLEKLDNLAPDYELLNVVKDMEALKSLELINIEIKDGFDHVLAHCKNIENFLIIPLYISQSATTNQLVLDGIKNLAESLKCFVWGLTTELLKVTDLFMDQWQPKSSGGASANNTASNKKSTGDSIPVRKLVDKPPTDGDAAPTHVDILPIPKLERILATNLPKSRIKVIKVPFHMTWRQSLAECMK